MLYHDFSHFLSLQLLVTVQYYIQYLISHYMESTHFQNGYSQSVFNNWEFHKNVFLSHYFLSTNMNQINHQKNKKCQSYCQWVQKVGSNSLHASEPCDLARVWLAGICVSVVILVDNKLWPHHTGQSLPSFEPASMFQRFPPHWPSLKGLIHWKD